MAAVPDPPTSLALELEPWAAGREIVRVVLTTRDSAGFHPAPGSARFRPVLDQSGQLVPTLYGAENADAALAESILHDLSPRRRSTIPYERLRDRMLVRLAPTRELRLAAMHGAGLQRAQIKRTQLIDTLPPSYPQTAKWGQVIHDHPEHVDGIVWMSRQFDSRRALMLFGDRVRPDELTPTSGSTLHLGAGAGYELAAATCLRAGFRINRS